MEGIWYPFGWFPVCMTAAIRIQKHAASAPSPASASTSSAPSSSMAVSVAATVAMPMSVAVMMAVMIAVHSALMFWAPGLLRISLGRSGRCDETVVRWRVCRCGSGRYLRLRWRNIGCRTAPAVRVCFRRTGMSHTRRHVRLFSVATSWHDGGKLRSFARTALWRLIWRGSRLIQRAFGDSSRIDSCPAGCLRFRLDCVRPRMCRWQLWRR